MEYSKDNFLNRELSWLEFNGRVLEQAEDKTNPLLERLKFLSITSSNLDEFFMIRVAGLKAQIQSEYNQQDISGLTPKEQLQKVEKATIELVKNQYTIYNSKLLKELKKEKSFYETLDEKTKNFYQLNKTKILYEVNFKKHKDFRTKSLYIGSLALPLLAMFLLASGSYSSTIFILTISIIVSFSSEIVSRLLFYKTAVALGLAGNFFAGNQRN